MRHLRFPSPRRGFRLALLALAAAGLSACQGHRFQLASGSTWRPTGVVQSDIESQLADRHDLLRGRGSDLTPAAIVLPGIDAWENGAAKGPNGGGPGQTGSLSGSASASGSAGATTAGGGGSGMP